jgi:hypothetical protein
MGEKSRSGSGMNFSDQISESLKTIFCVKILKFFYADADPDPGIFLTLDLVRTERRQRTEIRGGWQIVVQIVLAERGSSVRWFFLQFQHI